MVLGVEIKMLRERFGSFSDEILLLDSHLQALDKPNNDTMDHCCINFDALKETSKKVENGIMLEIREKIGKLNKNIERLTQLSRKLRSVGDMTACEKPPDSPRAESLSNDDILRYSRQLIIPDFGVSGQLKLKQSSFLIVGVGGLGCPAAHYLTAAGCGRLGLVDYDSVECSNFHRQTLHTARYIGQPKVCSAKGMLEQINPHCQIDTHQQLLNNENALALVAQYDIILDCTDNVATRYLLNDACVMLSKPLVSGSALQLDGQLTVYNYGGGPCYRCLFPIPPPPETVSNCGDSGVLGAVTGVIGSLQALEALKVATGLGEALGGRLLIFDGTCCTFRNIKLRSKRSECEICSPTPSITRLINYEQFCGMEASDKDRAVALLEPNQRISVYEYNEQLRQRPHVLIDVRSAAEFEICKLPHAVNVPLKQVLNDDFTEIFRKQFKDEQCRLLPFIVCCRRGNDSQIAVQRMRNKFPELAEGIKDIAGGLHAWHYSIDKNFPIY